MAVTGAAFVGVGGFAIVPGEAEEVAAVGPPLVLVLVMHKPKSSSSADMCIL